MKDEFLTIKAKFLKTAVEYAFANNQSYVHIALPDILNVSVDGVVIAKINDETFLNKSKNFYGKAYMISSTEWNEISVLKMLSVIYDVPMWRLVS